MPRKYALLGFLLIACTADAGHPPLARIDIAPGAIPAHDDFETVVTLDGSTSADPIDDPGGSEQLQYLWTIVGDDVEFQAGSHEDQAKPKVTFRGERPATVTLTVTDPDGQEASATSYVQLTVR